jgi:hypothetical protein
MALLMSKCFKTVRSIELVGGPHGLLWSHSDEVNLALVEFLA